MNIKKLNYKIVRNTEIAWKDNIELVCCTRGSIKCDNMLIPENKCLLDNS